MKLFIVLVAWILILSILIYFYKIIIRQILKLNKGLIEIIDFAFSNIIQELIYNKNKIIDFEKVVTILEEEKSQIYAPPYNLDSLKKGWNIAKQQQEFLSKLLKLKNFSDEKQINQLLKILYVLCKVKNFMKILLVVLTIGTFLLFEKRIIKGVYIYC